MKISWGILLLSCIGIAIVANLVVLDYRLLHSTPAAPNTPTAASPSASVCGDDCKRFIQDEIGRALTSLPKPSPAIIKETLTQTTKSAKEFFIPLGSGSTQNDQWEDISGAEGYIDSARYQNIQTVFFEVTMHIPTKNGTVFARLYDVTDQHPVWFSDVSTESDTSTLLSSKITLDPGNKHYRVQMRTSLKYQSLLDFARVKIITN